MAKIIQAAGRDLLLAKIGANVVSERIKAQKSKLEVYQGARLDAQVYDKIEAGTNNSTQNVMMRVAQSIGCHLRRFYVGI